MTRLITANRDIELREDDLLVLECPHKLTQEQAEHIRDRVRESLGIRAIVLDGGLRLATVLEDPGTPIYDALLADQP